MKYVAGLMFSEDRQNVAMVIKNRPAWQSGLFNAIGGKIEEGECPATAMAREFQEETGVTTTPTEWEYFTRIEGEWGEVTFFRMFTNRVFEVQTMEDEVIQIVRTTSIPQNSIMNIKWLVPLAADTAAIAPRIIKYR